MQLSLKPSELNEVYAWAREYSEPDSEQRWAEMPLQGKRPIIAAGKYLEDVRKQLSEENWRKFLSDIFQFTPSFAEELIARAKLVTRHEKHSLDTRTFRRD